MKNFESSKTFGEKVEKMTLKDYYHSLPNQTCPKTEFVNNVAQACNVSTNSVRNWIAYGIKPSSHESVRILSEMTGIPENELWKE